MKGLIITLKIIMGIVSVFALMDMIATENIEFICLPLGILCCACWDIIHAYKLEFPTTYEVNHNQHSSWNNNNHHIVWSNTSWDNTKKDEENANKLVKRGVKISIENK